VREPSKCMGRESTAKIPRDVDYSKIYDNIQL
jgi:hypothetical protein